jgi:hypothetical protein
LAPRRKLGGRDRKHGDQRKTREEDMNSYELDSLSLVGREHREQRLRDADAERLARALRATAHHRRRRLRMPMNLVFGARQRLRAKRLEI